MSTEEDKFKHSKRLLKDNNAIAKQTAIAKQSYPVGVKDHKDLINPHRMHKRHAMDCGNPECGICGNPRTIHKERTTQEKRLFQDIDKPNNKHSNGVPPENEDLL